MPRPSRVKVGDRYGRLVVCAEDLARSLGRKHYEVLCDCGNRLAVRGSSLRSGNTRSCGCSRIRLRVEVWRPPAHGLSKHELYATWLLMHQRCSNPNIDAYHWYGGRGIYMCARWSGRYGFPNFLADMGERPGGLTLDRKDNDGNYEHCRWATRKEQAQNRRSRSTQSAVG